MKTSKKNLLMSLAIFAVAFVAFIVCIALSANGAVQTKSAQVNETEKSVDVQPIKVNTPVIQESAAIQPPESVADAPKAAEVYQQPIVTPNAEQKQQEQPQPERIPFTNEQVTAGDPQSYIGTYGQCPFYENAMEGKGCVPPPDVECNADWSVCTKKGE